MMELRKVQEIGGALLISLPKQWAEGSRIRKGSILALELRGDGTLMIRPFKGEEERPKELKVPYPTPSQLHLQNTITAAYLLGFDTIRITGEARISFEDREALKRACRQLIGLEIVEEDARSVTLQFLLQTESLSLESLFRRMHLLTEGMCRDALNSIVEGDEHLARVVVERDEEVDRIYFLIVRLIRSAMITPLLPSKLKLSLVDLLDYRVASHLLERIGDASVGIVEMRGDGLKLEGEERRILGEAGKNLEEMQSLAVEAFLSKSRESIEELQRREDELFRNLNHMTMNARSRLPALAELVKEIARHIIDIADLATPLTYSPS
ncbi:phosphate uptake regulator PhoU [Candidatus Bathyarchaeota archaeon]|nr:phosphate uptake regulator PhoU [Candidatus Bathyarchaeota archaeon]